VLQELRHAEWTWAAWAVAASVITYIAAALGLMGAVPGHIPFSGTLGAQLAGSFVSRITPTRAGGIATNVRYLQKLGVDLLAAVFVAGGLALAARRPRMALAVAASGSTAWASAKLVKRVVERGRPASLLPDVPIFGKPQSGLGFPSGHAAVAAAMMTAASPYLSPPVRIAGWTVVGFVATARMYVGAHLPLDAAGGLFLGWTIGSAVGLRPAGPGVREETG
jgi:membrane-associated phospholipid phosphatase